MPSLRSLHKLDYTGKQPYSALRGMLPEGYRILNKKQTAAFKRAQKRTECTFRRINGADHASGRLHPGVAVQLHRNEQVLNNAESRVYEGIMRRAGAPFKK